MQTHMYTCIERAVCACVCMECAVHVYTVMCCRKSPNSLTSLVSASLGVLSVTEWTKAKYTASKWRGGGGGERK